MTVVVDWRTLRRLYPSRRRWRGAASIVLVSSHSAPIITDPVTPRLKEDGMDRRKRCGRNVSPVKYWKYGFSSASITPPRTAECRGCKIHQASHQSRWRWKSALSLREEPGAFLIKELPVDQRKPAYQLMAQCRSEIASRGRQQIFLFQRDDYGASWPAQIAGFFNAIL